MSAKVYVVQKQHRWDEDKQAFVPKFDLSSAEKYGELIYLLTPTAAPFNTMPVVKELHEKLYWFGDEDSLLLIGNPVLIGCAVTVAAKTNNGRVKMLQWSGTERRYIQIQAEMG
jgi:hypothetical protein